MGLPIPAEDREDRWTIRRIGFVFIGYGLLEALVLTVPMNLGQLEMTPEMLAALGRADYILPFAIPMLLVLTGAGLVQYRGWAYRAAVLLPLLIVPLAVWWMVSPDGLFGPKFRIDSPGDWLGLGAVLGSL
jgi:hypothetical protein